MTPAGFLAGIIGAPIRIAEFAAASPACGAAIAPFAAPADIGWAGSGSWVRFRRPESIDEYERIHRDVPGAVLARLRASHVSNYSIYRYGTLLVAYLEYGGDDLDADLAAIAADPATQAWWRITEPLQDPVPERAAGEWWHELPEVFHLA